MLRTFALTVLLCLFSHTALASHYDLPDASFIPKADIERLMKAGIADTEALLNAGLTPEARKCLATASGVAQAALDSYVQFCDLLRISGIGPEMAMLLQLVGVPTAKDLAAASVNPLHKKLLDMNDAKHLMGVIPQPQTLEAWIARAASLPVIVK